MLEGSIAALEAVQRATGESKVVERLAGVDRTAKRRGKSAGTSTRRPRIERDRGCAGQLRDVSSGIKK
jgi:hypothetical protein